MDRQREWTISDLAEEVAATGRYAGGGAVAAMSLVGAAATAELVINLSRRRRGLDESDLELLGRLARQASELRASFLALIDADIASLTELMSAQRALRQARKSEDTGQIATAAEQMQRAVRAASEEPLQGARDAYTLLQCVHEARPLARSFTMSDLGAAAATTHGAIVSLLFMAEVNLGFLKEPEYAERMAGEIEELGQNASDIADSIISATWAAIRFDSDSG